MRTPTGNDRLSVIRNTHANLLLQMQQKVGMGILCNVRGLLRPIWPGARREVLPHGHQEHPPGSGAVTDEQRSARANGAQPSGRRFFAAPAALLAPYRPLKGMLVACALPGPQTPRRKRHRIYAHDHKAAFAFLAIAATGAAIPASPERNFPCEFLVPALCPAGPGAFEALVDGVLNHD